MNYTKEQEAKGLDKVLDAVNSAPDPAETIKRLDAKNAELESQNEQLYWREQSWRNRFEWLTNAIAEAHLTLAVQHACDRRRDRTRSVHSNPKIRLSDMATAAAVHFEIAYSETLGDVDGFSPFLAQTIAVTEACDVWREMIKGYTPKEFGDESVPRLAGKRFAIAWFNERAKSLASRVETDANQQGWDEQQKADLGKPDPFDPQ